jgi:flagellar biosynthesis protein FlhF
MDDASMDKVVLNSYYNNNGDESKAPTVDKRVDARTASGLVEHKIIEQAWGSKARQNPDKARLLRQLLKLDINPLVIQRIANVLANNEFDMTTALPHALAVLANDLPIYKEDFTACGGTVALLGPTGVGKTTAIAKMAARFALTHGRNNVALVSTDGHRIAGAEQLRIYGKLLGIPLKVVSDDIELLDALNTFSEKPFVLIDTAGMGPKDVINSRYFDLFSGGITQIKNFLVLPATAHRSVLEETAQAYGHLKLDGSIITKVDETTRLGGPLSVAIVNDLPVAYFSDGQKVPDDFHPARAHTLISRAVRVIDQFDDAHPLTAPENNKAGVEANVCI